MTCRCGVTFRFTDYSPSREQFRLCDDAELFAITGEAARLAEDQTLSSEGRRWAIEELPSAMLDCAMDAVECPSCHRLLILTNNRLVSSYVREGRPSDEPPESGHSFDTRPLWEQFKDLAKRRREKYGLMDDL